MSFLPVLPSEPTQMVSAPQGLCIMADAFIASKDVSHSSRLTYRGALKAFFAWLSTSGRGDRLNELTRFDILAYKDELGRTKRTNTANLYLLTVQGFFAWLRGRFSLRFLAAAVDITCRHVRSVGL